MVRLRREEPIPTDLGGDPFHEPREYSWDGQGLWIARELGAGNVRIVLPKHKDSNDATYVCQLHELAAKYPMVSFVPKDGVAYERGQTNWEVAREQDRRLRPPSPLPLTNAGPQAWGRLHEALDVYTEHIRSRDRDRAPDGDLRLTAFGNLKIEQARRIKTRQKDRPLSALDFHGCPGTSGLLATAAPNAAPPREGGPTDDQEDL